MKAIVFQITLFFLLQPLVAQSQDTLRDITAYMYSMEYYLFEDGSFKSTFAHCTGVTYGKGTYQKKWNRMVLVYDSITPPKSSYLCTGSGSEDSLKITVLSAVDSSVQAARVLVDGRPLFIDSTQSIYWKPPMDSLRLTVIAADDVTIYPEKGQCRSYIIYVTSSWITYDSPGETILKKDKKNRYYIKHIHWDENQDEPWKKGERRKTYTVYELFEGPAD